MRSEIEDEAQRRIKPAQFLERQMAQALSETAAIDPAVCSASTPVMRPAISTSGRKLAARAEVEVGSTNHVDRGSSSD
jgi:hypothetical protein